MGCRVEASPVGSPRQNGELADRPSRSGRSTSTPLTTLSLVGVVDRDMHMEAEDQLPAGDVLHLVDQRAIAVAGGDPLTFEQAERMGAGRADAEPVLGGNA